jgi:hypothetical protein
MLSCSKQTISCKDNFGTDQDCCRWYIQHHKNDKAFRSFQRVRNSDLQAARDTYYTYVGVELEREANKGRNVFTQFIELFTVPRNRRAAWASWIVMFGQYKPVSIFSEIFMLRYG